MVRPADNISIEVAEELELGIREWATYEGKGGYVSRGG